MGLKHRGFRRPLTRQQGFSLVEVLVAGAIMGFGLAALAALLLNSMSGTAQSAYRTIASSLAESIASAVRISPSAETIFLASPPAVTQDCRAGAACSAADFAASNLKTWHIRVAVSLPEGVGVVCLDSTPQDGSAGSASCDGSGRVVVKLFWRAGARLGPVPARLVREVA